MQRLIRAMVTWCATAACLAVAGRAMVGRADAGESGKGTRVPGVNYSCTSQPLITDQPSDEFLADADTTEGDAETAYRGIGQYLLFQGNRIDDKLKYCSTDFVHWTSSGAVLRAEGQCHDADPTESTRVSSEAWGAQVVDAVVTTQEGSFGTISAENRIGFSYSYNISGSRILEATVQLRGTCVDLNGGTHRFSLSDTRASSVTESLREVRVRGVKARMGGRASESSGRSGGTSGSEVTGSLTMESEDTVDVTITRSLAQAGSDAGSVSGAYLQDEVSGPTPLRKTYDVYSAGGVVLTARGDGAEGGSGVTHVFLEDFSLENVLRVYKSAEGDPSSPPDVGPEPQPPEPGSGGPTTGGGDGGTGDAEPGDGEGGDSGEGDSESDSASPGGAYEGDGLDDAGIPRSELPLDGVEGLDDLTARVEVFAPFGLAGEPGGQAGELRVGLDAAAPRDLVFAVRVEPEGALQFPRGDRITIESGRRAGGDPFGDAVLPVDPDGSPSTGEAFLFLHLLEEDGTPSGREVAVRVPLASITTRSAPRLYACAECDAWQAGADAIVRGIRGRRAPDLVIGRLGFDGYASAATVVALQVVDPAGVLGAIPGTVSIGPGESEVRVALMLNDVEGEAQIRLTAGDESLQVLVRSRTQGWSAPPVIRVPLGATAAVPYRLSWPDPDAREVSAVVEEGGAAALVAGSELDSLPPGATLWAAQVRGLTLGSATVRLACEGLPVLRVPVEVVPARLELLGGRLRLNGLPVGTSGTIELRAPKGVRIRSLTVPPELADVLTVVGLGGEEITVRLQASPELSSPIALPIELEGLVTGSLTFDVLELLEEDAPPPHTNNYQVEWR